MLPDHLASYEDLKARFRWRIPDRFSIATEVCDRQPADAVAVIEHDEHGSATRVTHSELRTMSAQLAGGLRKLGVGRGDRVASILPQGALTLALHLACFRLGALSVPIAPVFAGEGLRFRLADSGSRVAVVDSAGLERTSAIERPASLRAVVSTDEGAPSDLSVSALMNAGAPVLDPVSMDRDDPAFIFYTSGTTGPPKGAVIASRTLFAIVPGFQLVFDLAPRPDDVFWTPSDWSWLGALCEVVLPAAYFGRPIVAAPTRFSVERAYRILSDHAVTCAFLAPTVLRRMRAEPPPPQLPLRLRAIMTGGERLGVELREFAEGAFGASLNDDFGLKEATDLAVGCEALYHTPPGAIGQPIPGRRIAILSEHGEPLPEGVVGEIAVSAGDPIVMLGYWNRPDETEARVRDGWFRTGDRGRLDAEGFLWFEGRMDDVLKAGGMQIGAEEIEVTIATHPDVLEAGVTEVTGPEGQNVIAAFVRVRDGVIASDALGDDLRRLVRRQLAAHAYPRIVRFVDSLPLTSTGKIRRQELRRIYEAEP